MSLALYVDRYGSGHQYPAASGSAFWNVLRTVPTRATSMLPDNDGLFVCKVKKTPPGPNVIDYRGPAPGVSFPVTEELGANTAIGSDRVTNHSPTGNDDINVLLFDGHVENAPFGSQLWSRAGLETSD